MSLFSKQAEQRQRMAALTIQSIGQRVDLYRTKTGDFDELTQSLPTDTEETVIGASEYLFVNQSVSIKSQLGIDVFEIGDKSATSRDWLVAKLTADIKENDRFEWQGNVYTVKAVVPFQGMFLIGDIKLAYGDETAN